MKGTIKIDGRDPKGLMTPEQVKEHVDRVHEAIKNVPVIDLSPVLSGIEQIDARLRWIEEKILDMLTVKGLDPGSLMTPDQIKDRVEKVHKAMKEHVERIEESSANISPVLEKLDGMKELLNMAFDAIRDILQKLNRPSFRQRLWAWIRMTLKGGKHVQ
jgi:hypothetical protein